jgi:hypothetical protein
MYIDSNDKPTWLAYNETTGLVEAVRVDPTLGYLEVFVVAPDSNTPTAINRAFIDANDNQTLTGYNETTGLIEALRCGSGGELLIISV